MIKHFRLLSILIALVTGGALTLLGLSQTPWPLASPDSQNLLYCYIVSALVGALFLEVISRKLKVSRLIAGCGAGGLLAVLTGTIWPLIVVLWFGFASYLLGSIILSLTKISVEKLSIITIALVGAAIYGTVVGLMAHYPINYPGLYGVALAAPLILKWRFLYKKATRYLGKNRHSATEPNWLDLPITLMLLAHFIVALMPELGHDALAMHLFVPGHLTSRGEWSFDIDKYVWAVMPMMGDWLFSIGYMLAGETAARLINVGFIFMLSWLIRDMVIWAGGSLNGAKWAALLFLTTPLTFTESSSLFIESIWATFIVAGSLSIFKLIQREGDSSANLPVASILLGAALAAKAITFTILPVLMLLLIWRYRTWCRYKLIGVLSLGLVLFISIGGIPYATAWHLTGNPVFPFFNHIFKSPLWPAVAFEAPNIFGKGLAWDTMYQATFHTETFLESKPGASGFSWLLLFVPALLALLFSRKYKGIMLFVVGILCIASTFQSTTYLRYVFPSFAWITAGIGVAFSFIKTDGALIRRALFTAGAVAILLNLLFFNSGSYFAELGLQPLLSQAGRERYLNQRLPIRSAVQLVNQLNSEDTDVAVFASPSVAGLNADALYPNWYNYRFDAKVREATTSTDIAQLLIENNAYYVILDNGWGTPIQRKIIDDATDVISNLGAVSVRKLKNSLQFQTELLKNPKFSSFEGWILPSDEREQLLGQIIVSVSSPVVQLVSVTPGQRYQNTVRAACEDHPTQGRIQVNWLDSKSNFISTNIQVFDCASTSTSYTMEASAPEKAATAVVYGSGHTTIPIIFSEISFKK